MIMSSIREYKDAWFTPDTYDTVHCLSLIFSKGSIFFVQVYLHQKHTVTVSAFPTSSQRHSPQDQEHPRGHTGG